MAKLVHVTTRVVSALSIVLLVASIGCAAKQRVDLACIPRDVRIYVDGRQLRPGTEAVELGVSEAHKLYFTGGGFEPQLVVLDRVEGEDGPVLIPHDVCSKTTFQAVRPEVRFELEEEPPPGP